MSAAPKQPVLPLITSADLAVEESFHQILDAIGDMVLVKGAKSRVIWANKAFCIHYGMNNEQLKNMIDAPFNEPDYTNQYVKDDAYVYENGKILDIPEEPVTRHDGVVRYFHTVKSPIFDRDGKVIATVGISRDITEKKAAQKELEEEKARSIRASRLAGMSEVATGILHNVGNVLNSVNISTNLIRERVELFKVASLQKLSALVNENVKDLKSFMENDPRGREIPKFLSLLAASFEEHQATVRKECQTLADKVEHIKNVIHAQQRYGKTSSFVEVLSLKKMIEDAIQIASSSTNTNPVKVDFSCKEPFVVHADQHKVLQILVNLIKNAQEAVRTVAQPRIEVEVTKGSDDVMQVLVRDNGVGISTEVLQNLFKFGFTTRPDGHGTGLHFSCLAAKELGGDLMAESAGEQKGATFRFRIPVKIKAE